MKQCATCKEWKNYELFSKKASTLDGYRGQCKTCIAEYRIRTREQAKNYREKNKLYYALYQKVYDAEHKEEHNQNQNKHKIQRKARYEVKQALKNGLLRKLPCEICGGIKTQAHHTDYTKPLSVQWLCRKHHSEIHRN